MTTTTEPFVDPNRLSNGLPNGTDPLIDPVAVQQEMARMRRDVEFMAKHEQVHSSVAAGLQARVDALAQSVGAPKQNNLHPGYDPDLFLEALKQRHDALAMITDRLEKRHAEQEERQRELDKREKQVSFREKRISAHERLSDKSKWRLW